MNLGQFLILYLMAGCGVAGAAYLSPVALGGAARWFHLGAALVFWPLYLPLLLTPTTAARPAPSAPPCDELAQTIAQVDLELEGALEGLDGWAEGVLAHEQDRLRELRTLWLAQAQRIRELDRLLAQPAYAGIDRAPPSALDPAQRAHDSQRVIRQNVQRLRQVRDRTMRELLDTLSWVRELVSMIHLARFTGAPAARAEELVGQIAAAVEGLSEVSCES
jgi:hypothetical protein